jgi:serine/threonine protein kinase
VLGPKQIGKFMTIYPANDCRAKEMAEHLVRVTADFDGPVVVTDLRLGRVVYTRFGGFNPETRRDRLGQISTLLERPDGTFEPDDYKVPFVPPQWTDNPFADFSAFAPVPSAATGRLFGPGYLLLNTLKSNPKGSVFLALDMRDRTTVGPKVIKEGRQHCLSDAYGRDIRDRLRRQLSLHQRFRGRIPLPAAEQYFEVAGNGYLVVEHIDGHALGMRESRPFAVLNTAERHDLIAPMLSVLTAVEALHQSGHAHRDLAPSNIIIGADGAARLLDLELAASVGSDEPIFTSGTPGFMSPQQEAGEPASFADDIFAIGSLLIVLMSQIDPRRILFASERDRYRQVRELTGSQPDLAKIIADCVSNAADKRPSLAIIRHSLEHACATFAAPAVRKVPDTVSLANLVNQTRERARDCVAGALHGLLQDVLMDEATGMWLSPAMRARPSAKIETASSFVVYRSASRGIAGVVYTLARMARCGIYNETVRHRVEAAVDWLLAHHFTDDDQMPGLHFGEAGVAVAIAEACAARLIDKGGWLADYLAEALHGPLDWPDVTHGAAGQGLAALICADVLGDPAIAARSHRCAEYLLDAQEKDGGWSLPDGVDGMTGERYTGFAHGAAGIVYFLTEYASHFDSSDALRGARGGAEWLIAKALRGAHNGVEWTMKETTEERWRWWCHGGPGISLCFLKLLECTGENRFADFARRALQAVPTDLRYSNLSQCHGLAGLGEIYLEADRLLGGDDWSLRGAQIAAVLIALARRSDTGALTWLVEDPVKSTGDLMIGSAGVSHFLLRFARKRSPIGFPLLPDPRAAERHRRGTGTST